VEGEMTKKETKGVRGRTAKVAVKLHITTNLKEKFIQGRKWG
jgi:hypothetical protein